MEEGSRLVVETNRPEGDVAVPAVAAPIPGLVSELPESSAADS